MQPLIRLPLVVTCLALLSGLELAPAQSVSIWMTTHDQSKLMQQQTPVSFASGSGGGNCIVVDETQLKQPIEGFGADFTDTTGYNLNEVASGPVRTNVMRALFTRDGLGIGLSFMRCPMGASDLARYQYSYDDLPSGQSDTNLTNFSVLHDDADIVPLIQEALQLNPQLTLMANPWSPPGWMKSTGSMVGGTLLPAMYGPFANYFVKYIQAYQARGISINYIGLQNEPLYQPGDYPGMGMDAPTQLVVLRDYVLPALAANHLTNRVLVYDHNWDNASYPDTVLSDSTVQASALVAGIAWHGYGGDPGAMMPLGAKYPAKGNYQTEHSGGTWVSDQLVADFQEITYVMRCSGRAYVKWNLAGDQNDGPHSGGCGTCSPLVIINSSTHYATYGLEFYTMGHFSKFVLPGAYRVYSANTSALLSAAFLNPDGSKALVVFNNTTSNSAFQVQWGGKVLSYSLPGYAGATFTWAGTQSGSSTLSATNQILGSSFGAVSSLRTEPCSDTAGGYDLGYAVSNSYALFQNVDFGAGVGMVMARVASGGNGGSLEFHLDSPTGPQVGSVAIPVTGGWQVWQTVTGAASGASGVHNLYVVFKGSSIGNLNWFQFGGLVCSPWTTADIGSVGVAGSAVVSSGAFYVSGSGADIESTADAFRYVYQAEGGDCEVRARVVSEQNTASWAKAGVMIRDGTAAGAMNAAVVVTPANGVEFQRRTSTGGTTPSTVAGGVSAPCWVRLARAANVFAAYYSTDGSNWTQVGTNVPISMSSQACAGLAVTAHNNTTNCAAVFDSVTVNQAPVLAAVGNQTSLAGRVLTVTNVASDADVPAQTLSYRLLASPPGAVLQTNSGLFTWRPTMAQAPSTQTVAIAVSDSGVPALSATQSFLVTVSRPVAPSVSAGRVTNGNLGFWLNGDAGPDYTIQSSTNLNSWTTVVTTNAPVLPWLWLDTNVSRIPAIYYRVRLGP